MDLPYLKTLAEGGGRLSDSSFSTIADYAEKSDKCYDSFDFICKKSGDYKLLITFHNGKAGCAVVVVSKLEWLLALV